MPHAGNAVRWADPMQTLPETVQSGYPEKTFRFTGEWEHMNLYSQRGSKVARRNRTPIWYPIYKADDGEVILVTWLMSKVCPTLRAIDAAPAASQSDKL